MDSANGDRRFTVRNKSIPWSLIAIVTSNDPPELEVDEICVECEHRGAIWHVHPENEEHKGSPNFKPFQYTPQILRAMADRMEKEEQR
jgi:hypothetical protein